MFVTVLPNSVAQYTIQYCSLVYYWTVSLSLSLLLVQCRLAFYRIMSFSLFLIGWLDIIKASNSSVPSGNSPILGQCFSIIEKHYFVNIINKDEIICTNKKFSSQPIFRAYTPVSSYNIYICLRYIKKIFFRCKQYFLKFIYYF